MELFTDTEILALRKETKGCANVIHLNNAGASLMPDTVTRSIIDHLTLESEIGGYEAASLKSEDIRGFYTVAAKLLSCKPANIAFTASATDSFTRALSSIPFKTSDTILTSNDDYISNQIQYLSLQKRFGINVVRLRNSTSGGIDLNDLDHQLKTQHPRLVALTHIPTNSGLVQPAKEIGGIIKNYDTIYLLDACQSIGQMPLDVKELHCDFLSATSRKFLRGPRGAGLLFVSDKALSIGLEPLFIDMRGAAWTEKDQYVPRADATRFEDWEFAYALLLGTKTSIEYALHVGLEKTYRRVRHLSEYARSKFQEISKVRVLDRGPELGAIVTFTVPGADPSWLTRELHNRSINVVPSYREYAVIDFDQKKTGWAIRVSPHYYNTTGEIDVAVLALRDILKEKSIL